MSFWKKVVKKVVKPLVKGLVYASAFLGGLSAAVATSPHQPKVDLSNSRQPVQIVYVDRKGAIPSNAIPSNAIPSNAIPSNAIPSNAIPSNAIPSNAIPSNAIPSNAIPSNAIPSNFIQGVKFSRLPDFGEKVCGSGRCTEKTKYTYYSDQAYQAGVELAGPSEPIDVQIWADAYALTSGECTNIRWRVTGSNQVWFNGTSSDSDGAKQVCPEVSQSYAVDAVGVDGSRAGSLVYIEVQEASAQPATGAEQASVADRCDLFGGLDMSVVYLDWQPGSPLKFYFKIPDGVPGLERQIPGDSGSWEYSAAIGDYSTNNCGYEGYKERLYCSISLPSGYSNAVRPLSLSVNGCDSAVFNDQMAYLPGIEGSAGGGGGGSNACPAGQTYHDPTAWWGGGCCSDGHWYTLSGDTEPGCWN